MDIQLTATHDDCLISILPPPSLNQNEHFFLQIICKHTAEKEMTKSQHGLVKNKLCQANINSFVTGSQACG